MLSPYYKKARIEEELAKVPMQPDAGMLPIDTSMGVIAPPSEQPQPPQMAMGPSPTGDFKQDMAKYFAQRAGRGMQGEQENQITADDINRAAEQARMRALSVGLTSAANNVGNFGGKAADMSGLQKSADAFDAAEKDRLAGLRKNYGEAGQDIESGYKGMLSEKQRPLEMQLLKNKALTSDLEPEQARIKADTAKLDFSNRQALSDPNSLESEFARRHVRSLGKKVPDNATAMSLGAYSKDIMDKYRTDNASQTRLELANIKNNAAGIAKPKPLSGEQKARYDNLRMGYEALQKMEEALQNGDNTFSIIGDNDYTLAQRNFIEGLGRMQSGGAITKDEDERFKKMTPNVADSVPMQRKKLQAMKHEFENRLQMFEHDNVPAIATSPIGGSAPSLPNSSTKRKEWVP